MKNAKHIKSSQLITFSITLFFSLQVAAQPLALESKLIGIDRVEEVMDVVTNHYQEIPLNMRGKTDDINYKHWARWGLYMSARTDGQGRAVDVQAELRKVRGQERTPSRSSNGTWFFRGPQAISGGNGSAIGIGRIDRIAFHPTDPNTLYAGSPGGGLLKSTNGGNNWTTLTDNLPSTAVSGIVVSHANANHIYILTGDGDSNNGGFVGSVGYWRSSAGVFASYDGGINWFQKALPIDVSYAGFALAQDPNNANILIAATSVGIYRSSNGGNSWTMVRAGLTYELKYRPGNSLNVYATQNGTFLRSIDGGITWSIVTNFDFVLPNGRVGLAVSNGQSNRVYLLSGAGQSGTNCDAAGTFGGLFISYNYGSSFTRQSNSPNIIESCCTGGNGRSQSGYDLAIGVEHTSAPNDIVAAGITTWRSNDNGVGWLNASPGRCNNSTSTGFMHADVHDVEYNPLNNTVYVCTDGGIVSSSNNGVAWVDRSDGLTVSQIYLMAGTQNDLNNMMIGLQDNGTKRRNSNTSTWDQVLSADGYDCVYFPSSATSGYLSWNTAIWRFSNNGSTNIKVNPALAPSEFFPRVQVHNTNSNIALFGFSDVYKTTSGDSSNWSNKGAAGNWDIERCPSNSSRFYAAGGSSAFSTTGNMWRSDNTGDSWTEVSGNLGYPGTNIRLTDIEVRENASANVYVSFGGFSDGEKVYVSYDAGVSWSNLSGSLPNVPVNAIQVDNNRNVYIGTDIGVYYRGVNMSDWVPFWHNLPIVPVTDLELYQSAGIVRASTFGRGVWESDTYSNCPQQWVIFTNIKGHRHYEVSNWISANTSIYGGAQTDVTFKAGDHITLSTGFNVGFGNNFRAYIRPCGVVAE